MPGVDAIEPRERVDCDSETCGCSAEAAQRWTALIRESARADPDMTALMPAAEAHKMRLAERQPVMETICMGTISAVTSVSNSDMVTATPASSEGVTP